MRAMSAAWAAKASCLPVLLVHQGSLLWYLLIHDLVPAWAGPLDPAPRNRETCCHSASPLPRGLDPKLPTCPLSPGADTTGEETLAATLVLQCMFIFGLLVFATIMVRGPPGAGPQQRRLVSSGMLAFETHAQGHDEPMRKGIMNPCARA